MKLQAASKKEISRIAVGTLVCDVIMIAGLFLLSQFGVGKFDILRTVSYTHLTLPTTSRV